METSTRVIEKFVEALTISQNELREMTAAWDTMAEMVDAFKVGVDEMIRKSQPLQRSSEDVVGSSI